MTASVEPVSDLTPAEGPKTRRNLLAAAVAGVGAWVATGVSRVAPVRAEGQPMVVGGDYANATSTTTLWNQTTGEPVFEARNSYSGLNLHALGARSETGHALLASSSSSNRAVVKCLAEGNNTGVFGFSGFQDQFHLTHGRAKTGVHGEAHQDTLSRGVSGQSDTGVGVYGLTSTGTGVLGFSGTGAQPTIVPNVGVYGEAYRSSISKGVWGKATNGQGVYGETTNGTAVYAKAPSNSGYGLRVGGKVSFSRSGKVAFAAGDASKTLSLPLLNSSSLVLATIQGNVAGMYVRGVSIDTAASTFTILLNKSTPSALSVGWFVIH